MPAGKRPVQKEERREHSRQQQNNQNTSHNVALTNTR
jgi:hypothetical protein